MNDNELITAVRDSFTDVHSATPVERIVGRGRALRARRRVPGVAAALGAAAVAAVAVSVALPASHPVGGSSAQLAAWTVARQDDGSIQVTIRELRDPAGLQATLRADGVPASVTFGGQPNPACQGYPFDGSPSQRRPADRHRLPAGQLQRVQRRPGPGQPAVHRRLARGAGQPRRATVPGCSTRWLTRSRWRSVKPRSARSWRWVSRSQIQSQCSETQSPGPMP
jgi:hypothetical protein